MNCADRLLISLKIGSVGQQWQQMAMGSFRETHDTHRLSHPNQLLQ